MPEQSDKENDKPSSAKGPTGSEQSDSGNALNLLNLRRDTVRIEGYDATHNKFGDGYQATGTIMSKLGDIVTSDHEITGSNIQRIDIQFDNGEHRAAKLFARDEKLGLAIFRVSEADGLPQPYYPLKFAEHGGVKQYTPTVTYGYMAHSTDLESVPGLVGQQKMINQVDEGVLRAETPQINRHMLAEDVKMISGQGFSGSATATEAGEVIGVIQFGIGKLVPNDRQIQMSDESLLTPSSAVSDFIAKVDQSDDNR